MRIRIVVADESVARFYDVEHRRGPLTKAGELAHPEGRLHERDLVSDRPGRVFDHAGAPGHRRGEVAHHATGGEQTAHRTESAKFARRVVHELETAHRHGDYDRLVVMSGPPFLGVLRDAIPKHMKSSVVAEVPKDLVHSPEKVVLEHLAPEAFEPAA
jgi:protein required for attachment to host cells